MRSDEPTAHCSLHSCGFKHTAGDSVSQTKGFVARIICMGDISQLRQRLICRLAVLLSVHRPLQAHLHTINLPHTLVPECTMEVGTLDIRLSRMRKRPEEGSRFTMWQCHSLWQGYLQPYSCKRSTWNQLL